MTQVTEALGEVRSRMPLPVLSPRPAPAAPGARRSNLDLALFFFDAAVLAAAPRMGLNLTVAAFAVLALTILAGQGGYRHRLSLMSSRELPKVIVAVATAAAVIGAVDPSADRSLQLLGAVPPAILMMTVSRFALGFVLRLRRRRGHNTQATIVVGAGIVGRRIVRHLVEHPEYGLIPVGFVDDAIDSQDGHPVLGRVDELAAVIERFGATQVIVAFGVTREGPLVSALRACEHQDVEFWAVPRFFEMGISGSSHHDEIWGLPLARLRRPALRTTQWRLKRVFDTVTSGLGLVLLSPALLLITLGVKATSRGPVFFRQRRIGQRGVPFDVLKFRTMQVNEDEAVTWDVTGDERVTLVGRFLRPTSLDELPQLFNVLRGDMSLVGPRPERPYFVEAFSRQYPRYDDRHRVPVGITGLAQVNGLRGDTSIEERAVFDNYYIENWSLWSDVVILLRTVAAVIRPPKSVRVSAKS